MVVTPAWGQALSAETVGRFFCDGEHEFAFTNSYICCNDNGNNSWHFALWVDDVHDICVSPADAAALPAGKCCAYISLLKTFMSDEAIAPPSSINVLFG